jgi:hypothetical protein
MSYGTILALCAISGLAFGLAGFGMLLIAVRQARREFRVKGFLRPPSGLRWINFLLLKHYDYFENPTTRSLFGAIHFCMMVTVIVLTGAAALIGSDILLNGTSGISVSTTNGFPTISLPK